MTLHIKGAWWNLPRRDLILLPLILLVTLTLTGLASEGVARVLFRRSVSSTMPCLVVNDPTTGVRGIPYSRCQQKAFESDLIDYRFNECGFRTDPPCARPRNGAFRIVLVGSSIAFGMHVPEQDTFAAKLGPILSRRLGRPVEVFNEAMQWGVPSNLALRTDSIVAARPDLILWTVAPYDITHAGLILPYTPTQPELSRGATPPAPAPVKQAWWELPEAAWGRLIGAISKARTVTMLQHVLYRSQSQYLSHTLPQGAEIDYLRSSPTAQERANLQLFADGLRTIFARAHAEHIPLAVTLLPSRAQAIMLASGTSAPGFDPHQLAAQVRPIAVAQGARYLDATSGLKNWPHAGDLFFAVDEHLPPAGHAMYASLLGDALARSGLIAPRPRTDRR